MIREMDHIGIAVENIEKAIETYTRLFGVTVDHREELSERSLEVAFLKVGDVMLELICPTSEESIVHKFLENKGEGLHHLCFKTDNVEETVQELKNQSFRLAQMPAKGAHGRIVAFLHPRDCHGVLIELAQEA
ncbi:methylmalonyl-CoA epimerase [candidate division TA06 bacterium]|uniref:Methylmalonyl-CoA epimerase n=1 Tax=candidate division TA06 bacterium TaxID=2250710 RepID=A0A523XVS2_UNCT6|nr:MAG: methylmalonyl-CoA epimerase [candidate division TA06 bacterium]